MPKVPGDFLKVDGQDHVSSTNQLCDRAAFSGVYSMNAFAAKAPVLIVALTERSTYAAALGGFFDIGFCRGGRVAGGIGRRFP